MFLSKTHKNGLTAAFLRQKQFSGSQIGYHKYGVRPFEGIDRLTERRFDTHSVFQELLHLKGDDLGVRGDIGRSLNSILFQNRLEFLIIIDISVQSGLYDADVVKTHGNSSVIDRMAVGG